MTDDDFTPQGDEGARAPQDEQPPEGAPLIEFNNNPFNPPDPTDDMVGHLYDATRDLLNELFTEVGVAAGIVNDPVTQVGLLQVAQDGLIHALINIHGLLHLTAEAARHDGD